MSGLQDLARAIASPDLAGEPSLSDFADRANNEHAAFEATQSAAVAHAIACGQALRQAKSLIPHGGWLKWLAENVDFTDQTARNYMKLAANPKRALDSGSVRAALAELTQTKQPARAKIEPWGESLSRRLWTVAADLAKGPLAAKFITEDEAWSISAAASEIVEMIGPVQAPPLRGVPGARARVGAER